ncbi:alpha/beta hydrolase [Flavobacterium branchiicola]|uniref:Alpha/beta hydrolase n=1 Tax=Flavobacterium branchiicola TaxID=1114875 RepID=A0ABV9PES6_9FLAO|nr:hypothetical protein [Flavobacterium branchiicola]MBS7254464.1 hypothetical protein [Flavobacterium branchiicola]
MNTLLRLIPVLFLFQYSFAQNGELINKQAIHFSLKEDKDAIDFIVIDTVLTTKKPVFLFCQGSLPMPLFVKPEKESMWMIAGGIRNFDIAKIKEHYHLVIISMPKTPVIAEEKNLNKSYSYIPNPDKPEDFDREFELSDYLENYQKRGNAVLKFLQKQKWVDSSKLVVAGHSQGSKVASALAVSNKKITQLGLFGANPFGRIDQLIRDDRKAAEAHAITWKEADESMEKNYQMLRDSYNEDKLNTKPYLLAWKSFSKPQINDWLKIEIPTYLAYATNDIASDLCDLVPLFYIQHSKTNLTYKRYLDLEHNFFEVKENGRADHEKPHWKEVMNDFIDWTLK